MKLLVPPKAAEWRTIHLSNSRDKTIQRLKDGARDHPDFISQILKNSDSKKALTETEIELNMALFISAGTDTTATTLTGWTYFVCTHPEVYERVVREVRDAFEGDEDIKWENVRKLRYLEATIYEALRLFPPVSRKVLSPRATYNTYTFIVGSESAADCPLWRRHNRWHLHTRRQDCCSLTLGIHALTPKFLLTRFVPSRAMARRRSEVQRRPLGCFSAVWNGT